jgi:hypothetical protein
MAAELDVDAVGPPLPRRRGRGYHRRRRGKEGPMRKAAVMAAAMLALAGCDRIGLFPGGGDADTSRSVGDNRTAGDGSPQNAAQVADAGVTRSRSLLGFGGGEPAAPAGPGDKVPTAIPAGARMVPPDLLVGRWSDDGNCKAAIEFLPDGSFRAANGEGGNWSLAGDRLTLTGAGGRYELRIQALDADTVVTQMADGSTGQSTRC